MSRIVALLVICLVLALGTGSQVTTKQTESLYNRAIEVRVSKQLAEFGKQSPETLLQLKNRIFEKDDPQTNGAPTVLDNIKLEYLTLNELSDRFQRHR